MCMSGYWVQQLAGCVEQVRAKQVPPPPEMYAPRWMCGWIVGDEDWPGLGPMTDGKGRVGSCGEKQSAPRAGRIDITVKWVVNDACQCHCRPLPASCMVDSSLRRWRQSEAVRSSVSRLESRTCWPPCRALPSLSFQLSPDSNRRCYILTLAVFYVAIKCAPENIHAN